MDPIIPPPGRPPEHRYAQAAPLPSIPAPEAVAPESAAAGPSDLSVAAVPALARRRRRSEAGALTKVQRQVTPTEEAAFAVIEAEMGGRQKLVATLVTAQLDDATSQLLGAIADPQHDTESLAKICALYGVAPAGLMKVFRTAVLTRGQMIATARIAEKAPDVAAAVMEDAIPGDKVCGKCLGARTTQRVKEKKDGEIIWEDVACEDCGGRGMVHYRPDHDVQKTALQIAGLLERGGGVKVTTLVANQNLNAGTDSGSYDKLIGALDGVIYGKGRDRMRSAPGQAADSDTPIEGEVVA